MYCFVTSNSVHRPSVITLLLLETLIELHQRGERFEYRKQKKTENLKKRWVRGIDNCKNRLTHPSPLKHPERTAKHHLPM